MATPARPRAQVEDTVAELGIEHVEGASGALLVLAVGRVGHLKPGIGSQCALRHGERPGGLATRVKERLTVETMTKREVPQRCSETGERSIRVRFSTLGPPR